MLDLLFARLIRRQWYGRAARRRDAIERAVVVGREDDHTVAVPRPAAPTRRVAKRLRGASRGVNLLKLAIGEKSNEVAVRRPERIRRAFSPCQRLRRERSERANPKRGHAVCV